MGHFPAARTWLATFCVSLAGLAVVDDARGEPGVDHGVATAPVSGSRLVPVFLTGEDDSRQFAGWFDRARNENCAFGLSADGVMRCLPTDSLEARLFVDAACTQRVVAVVGCTMPKYFIEPHVESCGSKERHRIREPGAKIRPPTVYSSAGGTCARVALDPAAVYVMVGREIAPSAFVAAKYATGRPGLGLKTEYEGSGS
jgi:hypothetical protein